MRTLNRVAFCQLTMVGAAMFDAAFQALLSVADTLPQLVGVIVTLVVCSYAIIAGGREERVAGGAICLASFATPLVQNLINGPLMRPTMVAIDVGLLLVLGSVALRSERFWPLWATGFHLLALLAYGAYALGSGILPPSLFTALNLIAYLVLLALLVGVLGRVRAGSEGPAA